MFQQSIKNFSVVFETANGNLTVSAGDLITGHISFDLTKVTRISSLTMKVRGRAHVHWSSGSRKRRRHYSEKMEFFSMKSIIMQENNGAVTKLEQISTDSHVEMTKFTAELYSLAQESVSIVRADFHDNSIGGDTKLPPGRHMYPFSCQIPQGDFPSSFRGPHGEIEYTLTVGINRPWHVSKDFQTELNFMSHIDPNQPDLWAPLSGSNSKMLCCLWCTSGPITMTATMERKAISPGETAKIICDFSNASSRTVTPKVKLQQKQLYRCQSSSQGKTICLNLALLTGEPLRAHTSLVHTEFMLTIPSSALFTISNCRLLDVLYTIEVSLGIKGSYDLVVEFPIILCDTSRQNNYLYSS